MCVTFNQRWQLATVSCCCDFKKHVTWHKQTLRVTTACYYRRVGAIFLIRCSFQLCQSSFCLFVLFSDIFINYRGQPAEQTGFADCGYFETSSSTAFAPVPSPVVTAPQLLIDTQLAQVLLLLISMYSCRNLLFATSIAKV